MKQNEHLEESTGKDRLQKEETITTPQISETKYYLSNELV